MGLEALAALEVTGDLAPRAVPRLRRLLEQELGNTGLHTAHSFVGNAAGGRPAMFGAWREAKGSRSNEPMGGRQPTLEVG